MLLLKFSTQELLVVHLSSWTSRSLKVTPSLTRTPPEKSCCHSREDNGTKSLDRVPATLAYRWWLLREENKNKHLRLGFPVWDAVWVETCHFQVNSVTAWIDGSSIYGPSSSWSDSLRNFSGGLLTSGSEWNMPSQEGERDLMWSAPDPSTGDRGAQGLFGETTFFSLSHTTTHSAASSSKTFFFS